jgi:hypothetical protein
MTSRAEWIEAAARELARLRGWDSLYNASIGGASLEPFYREASAALAVLEPLIRADERERCAKWHDQRSRDTPDAFEMELHQVSAAAIRKGEG